MNQLCKALVDIVAKADSKEEAVKRVIERLAWDNYVINAHAEIYSEDDMHENDELNEDNVNWMFSQLNKAKEQRLMPIAEKTVKPVFVDYVSSATPLYLSDEDVKRIAAELKDIAKEQEDK
ncbi:hypothetical protein CPT_Mater23 [Bacillus phage Mater]|uniref:Uncharacterized protein n=1 Tax=Bacillus phage Mater TaxID=1540090 RepID=A0A0A0RM96_9CAUD|nr:hypothetical protein CPT_Mater23 [Bacillus phage Mater]AIW03180.1 hypothetical protein CPT_Mater23 [Bacillus phage Mater]